LFSDEKFGSVKGNIYDDGTLRLNHSPHGALLHQSEDMMGMVESANNRPPAVDPEDQQYKVEKLIRKRRKGRKVQYWVKWLGYPDSENTWEAQQDIDPEIVAAFNASFVDGL
jgi:Chromo (CHRromatin Organisation MOdifier) domain